MAEPVIAKAKTSMEVAMSLPWLVDHCYGWQFGEQGILSELCRRLCVTDGFEIGAGDGEALPVTLDFLPNLTLFEIDQDKQKTLAKKFDTAKIYGAYDGSQAELVTDGSCVVVDIDSDDLAVAVTVLDAAKPSVIMVEHYDRCGPWMQAAGDPIEPWEDVPSWLIGMRLEQGGYAIQQPWQVVQAELATRGYVIVALSRVNGIYVRRDKLETLCQR
jgi:hypothetical protein